LPVTLPVALICPVVKILPDAVNVTAETTLAPVILPCGPVVVKLAPVTLPVAETIPPVKILPPIILPVPESAPPEPRAIKVLAEILPVALTIPVTLSPVGVNTATLPTPLTATVTLALAEAMDTFEVPLLILFELVLTPVNNAPLPKI